MQRLFSSPESSYWEQVGDFGLRDRVGTVPILRSVEFKNKHPSRKIKSIKFIGYKKNGFRLMVSFAKKDCLEFIENSFTRMLRGIAYKTDDSTFTFDPTSYLEVDEVLRLLNNIDPLETKIIQALPRILNSRLNPSITPPSLIERFPKYDPQFMMDTIDNSKSSLSYALNLSYSVFGDILKFNNSKTILSELSERINQFFEDSRFAFVARHEKGKLPEIIKDYYIISVSVSFDKGYILNNTLYQIKSMHYMVMNSDGAFSHCPSDEKLAQQLAAFGHRVHIPEVLKQFYVLSEYTKRDQNDNVVPICVDYEFVGYLYIKTMEKRFIKHPENTYRMLDNLEERAKVDPLLNAAYTEFKDRFFIFPPLPEFFNDSQDAIAEFYESVHAITPPRMGAAL